jgi:hypothetical protein
VSLTPVGNAASVRLWRLTTLALLAAACEARLGAPDAPSSSPRASDAPTPNGNAGPSTPVVEPPFDCDPAAPTWAPERLRRLTRLELENSIAALHDVFAPDPTAAAAAVADALDAVPDEILSDAADYRRLSQSVSQDHVDAWYRVARDVASAWTEFGPSALLGACDGTPSCVRRFAAELTRRAHRRPASEAELDALVGVVHGADPDDADALRDLITVVLTSPRFLYRLELGDAEAAPEGDVRPLDAYELAARLSYHFWSAPPDDALLAAAASGRLTTEDGYRAEVERLVDDPRADASIEAFFAQWLDLESVPALDRNADQARFAAYAGDDLPGPELRDRMAREVLDFVVHHVRERGTLADLFTSRAAFVRTADLAQIYGGVPLWRPGALPSELPAGERAGLLTRAALLAHAEAGTRPILRGARIRKRLLCDDLQLPEDMSNLRPPREDTASTTRERTDQLTAPSDCAGCHASLNPLGYALEGYDGLGRHRVVERTFDAEGQLQSELPIDTEVVPAIDRPGDDPVADGVALSRRLADNPRLQACFVRHYFRFTFGEPEDVTRDACSLDRLWRIVHEGGSLKDVLVAIAFEPSFSRVAKPEGS